MSENILFFCAHNDDQIVGAGGTIAKYSKEGKKIITIIFSYGEKSHPWIKPEHIVNTRINEAIKSNDILGGDKVIFFDLKEGNFKEDFKNKSIDKKIIKIINEYNPEKIFFHSEDDPHPDHIAVNKFIMDLIKNKTIKCDVYSFDVWTFIDFKSKTKPKMVVDISNTLTTKVKAFKTHKSQKFALFSLLWSIYLKAFLNGINYGYKYAEVFNKVK
ncbi:MAG: PIG-L deacetylase family protein [Candidatus Woesearchaeota archaeon]